MVAIRGHFKNGVFVPDEPVDLPQDEPVILHVQRLAADLPDAADLPECPPDKSIFEWIAENAVDDPRGRADGAHQHDHYLYGTPKKK